MARLDWRRARPARLTADKGTIISNDSANQLARRAAIAMRNWERSLPTKKRRSLDRVLKG
jgi:hypothetical protein